MKRYLFFTAAVVLLTLFLPLGAFPAEAPAVAAVFHPSSGEKEAEAVKLTVFFHETGETRTVELEDYLVGVLVAEMPLSFDEEALKAQAVAARTYVLYQANQRALGGGRAEHPRADVCTDYTHCKAYRAPETVKEGWGEEQGTHYLTKAKSAVSETKGLVLVYETRLINAVFHAISSGRTENCADIWGGDIPYLVSASSPGDKGAPDYHTTVEVTEEVFRKTMEENGAEKIPKDKKTWVGAAVRSGAGSVLKVTLCGKEFSGSKVRELFSLRSQNFEIQETETGFCFQVVGYGHGVGLSQYGAQAMARQGKDFAAILAHYYRGTALQNYEKIAKKTPLSV